MRTAINQFESVTQIIIRSFIFKYLLEYKTNILLKDTLKCNLKLYL